MAKSNKFDRRVTVDRELANKVRALRSALGLNQRQFASLIRCGQTQVSAWERGAARPSLDKLVAMGNEATNSKDRMFFWLRAGFSERRLREEFAGDLASKIGALSPELTIEVPLVDRLFVGGAGEVQSESKSSIPLPAQLLPRAPFVFCLTVGEGTPPLLAADDLVIVDRSRVKPEARAQIELPGGWLVDLMDRFITVFYERGPISTEFSPETFRNRPAARQLTERDQKESELNRATGRSRNPQFQADADQKNEELAARLEKRHAQEVTAPRVLFGTLRIQSDESWSRGEWNDLGKQHPWRLVLDRGTTWHGLTEWTTDSFPLDGSLDSRLGLGIHVLGVPIGWMREPRSSFSAGRGREEESPKGREE